MLTDRLEATVKSGISGIISIEPSVTVRWRGETIAEGREVYYLSFGQNTAVRDDAHRRVIMIDHDGNRTDLPCPDGASLAPDRFPGIDCWAGHNAYDFSITRYAGNGRVVSKLTAPTFVQKCGQVSIGMVGYDPRGEAVIGYECMVDGARMCRATTLGDSPVDMGEIPATTASVDCSYLIRTQGKPLSGVRSWSTVRN